MKKYILLLSFSVISYQANASEFVYDYSGTVDAFYGYTDYADSYQKEHKHNNTPASAEIYTSTGYVFDDESSIKIGADFQIASGKEIEDYNQGKWGENLDVTYNSDYGELSLGQIYNAAYQLAVGAPLIDYFRVNNTPITDFIANPDWQRNKHAVGYRTLNSTFLNTDADSLKVSYITPEYFHSKIAFSYTPENYSQAGLMNKHAKYENKSSYATGIYSDFDLDFAELETSLGYAYNRKNNQEVSAGLSLYRKGWTLGGSYRKSYTSSDDYELNLQTNDYTPYYFDGYRRSQAFNIGLSYEIGPFKTGLSYFASYADKTDNKDKIISLANRFAFNKYLAVYFTTAYAEYAKDGESAKGNRGFALISGLELTF